MLSIQQLGLRLYNTCDTVQIGAAYYRARRNASMASVIG
jgi:hypothetical protein